MMPQTMISSDAQRKLKTVLTEAVIALCKNGLTYQDGFTIEGLIGITLDFDDVLLVSINEQIKSDAKNTDNDDAIETPGSRKEEISGSHSKQEKRHFSDRNERLVEDCDSDEESQAKKQSMTGSAVRLGKAAHGGKTIYKCF